MGVSPSSGPIYRYKHYLSESVPYTSKRPLDWKVAVRAVHDDGVVEKTSEVFTLWLDRDLPELIAASSTATSAENSWLPYKVGSKGTIINAVFSDVINPSSVHPWDFAIVTKAGVYQPVEVEQGSDYTRIDLLFDRTLPGDDNWTLMLYGTIQDLAGNSSEGNHGVAVNK